MNTISKFRLTTFQQVRKRNIHIAPSIEAMRQYRKQNPNLAFVPTMGALHDGHLELVKRAQKLSNNVVVSIFVNPTQFSAGEDLDKYPRQLEADLAKLRSLGVSCAFTPSLLDMYPGNSLCHVEPASFSNIYEGRARPEFFRGVATIVCKLFNIVQPEHALFGQKDISQCILIQKMVHDLNMPVNVVVCPTIREADGLAMSSRNVYLAEGERKGSSILYSALSEAKALCESRIVSDHAADHEEVVSVARKVLAKEPLVTKVEYISVASHLDMTELPKVNKSTGAVISAAIRVGNVRLIDNVLVGRSSAEIGVIH